MAGDARANRGLTEAGEATIRAMLAAQLHDMADVFNGDMDRMAKKPAGVASDARRSPAPAQRQPRRPGRQRWRPLPAWVKPAWPTPCPWSATWRAPRPQPRTCAPRPKPPPPARPSDQLNPPHPRQHQPHGPERAPEVRATGRRGQAAQRHRGRATRLGRRPGRPRRPGRADPGPPRPRACQGRRHGIGLGALRRRRLLLEAAVAPIREAETKAGCDLPPLAERSEAMIAQLRQATARLDFHGAASDVMARVASEIAPTKPSPRRRPRPSSPSWPRSPSSTPWPANARCIGGMKRKKAEAAWRRASALMGTTKQHEMHERRAASLFRVFRVFRGSNECACGA